MKIITSHIGLDFDGFASCILLSKLYKNSFVYLPGALEGKLRHFIVKNQKYLTNVIYEIDLEKVKKLIIADTSSKNRLPHVLELLENLNSNSIIVYDHHGKDVSNIISDLQYIQQTGATTSIVVSQLIESNIELTSFEASIGLLGIYEDTNFMSFPGTTSYDLNAAGWLMEQGGDLLQVNSILKTKFSKRQIELLNKVITGLERFSFKGRDIAISTFESEKYEADISSILHRVMELEDLKLFFCIFQLDNKTYLIAKNNYEDLDLKKLMGLTFKGGGHSFVFTANFKKKTIFEIKKQVDEIVATIPSLIKAESIARPAVYTLTEFDNVDTAFNMMNRLRINSIAVKNCDNEVIGVVLRQDIDYAMSHNFEKMLIKELMNVEVFYVDANADIEEIRDTFLTSNRKLVFVKMKNNLTGIITRTEAFKRVLIHNSSSVKKISYKHRFKKMLPEKYIKIFDVVSNTAEELNTEIFIVGGFVRDLILRKKNFDFDFVVTYDGIKFAKKLAENLNAKCVQHEKFNTALIIMKDGTRLDIATSRFEYYKKPGALPTVAKGHLYHDLYRRDFSINAMAISLNRVDFGQLIDYFGGRKDLKERTIRVLHSLSFVDDPTRLIRAIRFKNRFKFKIGKTTESLMKAACSNKVYHNISGFRFVKEMSVLFSEENASIVFNDLEIFQVLHFIDEKISIDSYIRDLALKIDSVISWHKLLFKTSEINYWILYVFGILIHLKSKDILNVVEKLNLLKKQVNLLFKYKKTIRYLELFFNSIKSDDCKDSKLYSAFKEIEPEILLFAVAYFENEKHKKMISKYITYLVDFKLLINGDDILKYGIKKGPEIKTILDKVTEISIDNKIFDKKSQLKILKEEIKKDAQ